MFARLNMLAKGVSGKLWTKGKVHSRFTGNRSYATYKRFNNNSSTDFTKLLLDESGRKYLAVTFGLGGLFYVTHLEKAPLSERNRFIWVPIGIERQIGNYSYKSILNQTKGAILPENHPLTLRVDKIFRKIVQAAMHQPGVDQKQIENIQWKIHIVNDQEHLQMHLFYLMAKFLSFHQCLIYAKMMTVLPLFYHMNLHINWQDIPPKIYQKHLCILFLALYCTR